MTLKLGIIMDPIAKIQIKKDTTFALLLSAATKDWQLHYMELSDLFLKNNEPFAACCSVDVFHDQKKWFELGKKSIQSLADFDIILMRKDPPVDDAYVYATFILDAAERKGCLVVNKPSSLRNFNEKLAANLFPDLIAPTLVTSQRELLKAFVNEQQEVIFKPLNGMGGRSIFYVKKTDKNINVIIETLTQNSHLPIIAQRYIPEISEGDKRILMIDGEPYPFALARIPQGDEHRGNLATGGEGVSKPLSKQDKKICDAVGPWLKQQGILFAGLDVIGDYLTEINITSPTCVQELSRANNQNIADLILEKIANYLKQR